MKRVLTEALDKTENDFNLTSLIIDYKGRMQEKILGKMKDQCHKLFIVNPAKEKAAAALGKLEKRVDAMEK